MPRGARAFRRGVAGQAQLCRCVCATGHRDGPLRKRIGKVGPDQQRLVEMRERLLASPFLDEYEAPIKGVIGKWRTGAVQRNQGVRAILQRRSKSWFDLERPI